MPDQPPMHTTAEPEGRLLDCGHVGEFAGVCQYQGCATRLCADCLATCQLCGRVLCRGHQVWVANGQKVFCPADTRPYLGAQLVRHLVRGWRSTSTRREDR